MGTTRPSGIVRFGRMLVLALAAAAAGAGPAAAQQASPSAEEEVRRTIREYNAALQRGDASAVGRFWADEYTFVDPYGERLTKAQRLENLAGRRTVFEAVAPQVERERVLVFGDVALYQTVMRLAGEYSGQKHEGRYETIALLVKRDGRWQQIAAQLTRIAGEEQEDPAQMTEQTTWSGCLQAASAGFSYRLNLDPGTAFSGPADPASLGQPFVQLLGEPARMAELQRSAGKRIKVTGRQLSVEEAEHAAASRPDRQQAAETAAGTGGRPQRHLRYVRVSAVEEIPGGCK